MLFGKKEERVQLPDLPPLPPLPPKDQKPVSQAMPAFPELPEKAQGYEGASGSIQPPGRDDAYLKGPQPLTDKKVKVIEMQEWQPQNSQYSLPAFSQRRSLENEEGDDEAMGEPQHMPQISETHEEVEEEMLPPKPKELSNLPAPRGRYVQQKPRLRIAQPQQAADVFVRIDKFHTARKSLSEIKNRLNDIDELVRRIRDTKLREEQELAGWEKELLQIKSRVQTVTENIFEKVE